MRTKVSELSMAFSILSITFTSKVSIFSVISTARKGYTKQAGDVIQKE